MSTCVAGGEVVTEKGFEILDPAETLYRAARLWDRAADDWEAAAERLAGGTLGGADLGPAYEPHGADFARAYGASVGALRERLVAGAAAMHDAAWQLERSAGGYLKLDGETAGRIAGRG
jgi:hypothetical protein